MLFKYKLFGGMGWTSAEKKLCNNGNNYFPQKKFFEKVKRENKLTATVHDTRLKGNHFSLFLFYCSCCCSLFTLKHAMIIADQQK